MRSKERLPVVVAAVIVLQAAVPTVALIWPEKPNRLGWQMYSGIGTGADEDFSIVGQDGAEIEVDWGEVRAKPRRPELDWTRHLPEAICDQSDAIQVTVTNSGRTRTVTC